MNRVFFTVGTLLLALSVAGSAAAAVYVYPAKGQSQDQMSRDKYECHQWAAGSTGYDPMTATGSAQQNSALRGAARGAALGAIGGAIAGDAGKGAGIGAAVGGVGTGLRNRRRRVEYDQATGAADAEFARAYAACLEGRGYTVK